jgi:hypothetical protein
LLRECDLYGPNMWPTSCHSTIAAFVSSMKDEIPPLFRDVLLVCEEMKLLGGTVFALDGCKLSSNASKQWRTVSKLSFKEHMPQR